MSSRVCATGSHCLDVRHRRGSPAAALRLFLTVGCPSLSRVDVTVLAALSASLTSWNEFSDTHRKVERYTRAARSLKRLLSTWNSLSEVERSGQYWVNYLVDTSARTR